MNIDPYADDCIPIFIMLRLHVDKIECYCAVCTRLRMHFIENFKVNFDVPASMELPQFCYAMFCHYCETQNILGNFRKKRHHVVFIERHQICTIITYVGLIGQHLGSLSLEQVFALIL
jgi:hypothetical protein